MQALSASDLLTIWERGFGRSSVEQALAILDAALPEIPNDILTKIDVVQRDLCLLHLRGLTFGSQYEGLADCPVCHQHLELEFDAGELLNSDSQLPDLETTRSLNSESSFQMNNYFVMFRLPNSMDLKNLNPSIGRMEERQQLLDACVTSAKFIDKPIVVSDLPPEVVNGVVEHMSRSSPLADMTIRVTCPSCGHAWEIIFDIVSYFWSEINAWSTRLIREVHSLALAYGWHERDILAMSAWRRQRYLEMIGV